VLEGLKVIITRPLDQGTATAAAVAQAGGVPAVLPMIRILPAADTAACDEALAALDRFEGVVFASANAVHAFFERVRSVGIDPAVWHRVATYAVGPGTARALEREGVTAVAVPMASTGAALGALLGTGDVQGKRFFLPRGDRGREEIADALAAAGAAVVPVVVYHTAGPDPATAAAMRAELEAPGHKALFFASPSAVEEFARLFSVQKLDAAVQQCIVVVIGSTTGAAAGRFGIPVHATAAEATDSGMIGALASCQATHTRH
jgi:uroporphyrinogen-III synthase